MSSPPNKYPDVPNDVPPAPPWLDAPYGAYETQERLGTGPNADVFRASIASGGQRWTVVLKELRAADPAAFADWFDAGVRTWAGLHDHDNIVTVLGWGIDPRPWVALEYADGATARRRIDSTGAAEALWNGSRLADAVEHAHGRDVVHLALKPENVLFRSTTGDVWDVPKLSDWGVGTRLLDLDHLDGWTGYLAPEHVAPETFGAPDGYTDIYQVGAFVYEFLTGKRPFAGVTKDTASRVLDEPVRPPTEAVADLPPVVDDVLLTALAADKQNRYPSAGALRRGLEDAFEAVAPTRSGGGQDGRAAGSAAAGGVAPEAHRRSAGETGQADDGSVGQSRSDSMADRDEPAQDERTPGGAGRPQGGTDPSGAVRQGGGTGDPRDGPPASSSGTGRGPTSRRTLLRAGAGFGTVGLVAAGGFLWLDSDDETDDPGTETPAATETPRGTATTEATEEPVETETTGPPAGGTLRIALSRRPVELDPVVLTDVASKRLADLLFEGLYEYGAATDHVPALAAGPPEVSRGATRFVVDVDADAEFQHGEPVTAADVAYSFDAILAEETANAYQISMIDEVTAIDERTVQFDLGSARGSFMHTLHRNVVPEAVREQDPAAFASDPVGSGPFELVEWREGQRTQLARWDDYWGDEVPSLEGVVTVPVEDGSARVTALRNDDFDVVESVPNDRWGEVEAMADATVHDVPRSEYYYLAFNCREGPTADPSVREAVDYCVDMDRAVEQFLEPAAVRQYSPLPRPVAADWDMPLNEWERTFHDQDVERGRELLKAAGVSDSYDWRIIVPPDDRREQIGVSVAEGLQNAGFPNVEVQRLDWSTFLQQYVTGDEDDYNMYTLGWGGVPDPDTFTYNLLARTDDVLGITNGTYWGGDAGQRASNLFAEARELTDRSERRWRYREGIGLALESRVHLPAYNRKHSFGVREEVDDFRAHLEDGFRLASTVNDVSVDDG